MKHVRYGLVGFVIFFLVGCGPLTELKIASMVPENVDVAKTFSETVKLRVMGGKPAKIVEIPQVNNTNFQAALTQAIEKYRLFDGIAENGYYLLDAYIVRYSHQFAGTARAWLEVAWWLRNQKTNETVYRKLIKTQATASAADAHYFASKLVIAGERATNANISQALEEMSEMSVAVN